MDFEPPHHILSRTLASSGGLQLGDFSKVVNQYRALGIGSKQSTDASSSALKSVAHYNKVSGYSVSDTEEVLRPRITILKRPSLPKPQPPALLQQSRLDGPVAGPPLPHPHSSLRRGKSQETKIHSSKLKKILSYQSSEGGLVMPVFDTARTVDEVHKSLRRRLVPHSTADRHLARDFPSNASHGVYIFLDMSNIGISFQKALRKRYHIADNARFNSLPRLNLQFLTELLLRERSSKGLHVGCSIIPGRKEPRYVQELRQLGYHVDVRERKRIDNGAAATAQNLSKSTSRYVEDLVDETLQTRIAEAVMEHFQEQGTIVLATGDAKPAQYSDGFFRYVERALRMGWNVELVAWHGSLSSSWKDKGWTGLWGEKFRIIELDDFLYDLLDTRERAC